MNLEDDEIMMLWIIISMVIVTWLGFASKERVAQKKQKKVLNYDAVDKKILLTSTLKSGRVIQVFSGV
ncbi:MAG: hypothetical protein Ctma_0607 [Catillopecten margaritatus gill symbiont]|uniref:Preprotein translocase subunit YajC n=1 Tax=Catillopecten margaritatus gill symbiont TaxID=3083288 RepID=A0AAU6PFX8_9GAMM